MTAEALARRTGPLSSVMPAGNLVNLSTRLAEFLRLYGRLHGICLVRPNPSLSSIPEPEVGQKVGIPVLLHMDQSV
jgi:hypothetical protein